MKTLGGYKVTKFRALSEKEIVEEKRANSYNGTGHITYYTGTVIYPKDKKGIDFLEKITSKLNWNQYGRVANQYRSDCNISIKDIPVNKFRELKKYINMQPLKSIITRKKLLAHFEKRSGFNTTDCYRNYLHQAGFLRTISPGIYRIVKHIPETLSKRDLVKLAYENTLTY